MYGISVYNLWVKKYGKEIADKKFKELKEKDRISNSGENGAMFGKSLYSVWVEKLGKEEADRKLEEFKLGCKERSTGEKNPMYGKKQSEESIEKNRTSNLGNYEERYGKDKADEMKRKLGEKSAGENNPMAGKSFYNVWVVNFGKEIADQKLKEYKEKCKERVFVCKPETISQKHISKDNIEKYLNDGWILGKLKDNIL
jgi:hypothetical protein